MKKFLSFPKKSYLVLFILLNALYLLFHFFTFNQHMDNSLMSLVMGFFLTFFVFVIYFFIFIGVAQLTAFIWRKLVKSASQDSDLPVTFIVANLLFILLLEIYLDAYIKANADPRGEISMVGIAFFVAPFFTSIIGGVLSGSLVLFSQFDSRQVIKIGKIVSIAAVLFFFAYQFLTIRA